MRAYLLNAPNWVMFLVYGVPFGIAMGIFTAVEDGRTGSNARPRAC
jgi:hypothetical protein